MLDKIISFQNWFKVNKTLKKLFGKSIARCIPNLSFKRNDGKTITLTFANPSPIKGEKQKNIQDLMDTLNAYTSKKFGKFLFEGVDSIALHRAGEYKAFMNTILNSLCVVYHGDVSSSVQKFSEEFGPEAIDLWSQELSKVLNTRLNSVFETNAGEVKYYLDHMIQKFAHEKPSTYNQYYEASQKRGKVLSEDDHLLGYIIATAKEHKIEAPISNTMWERMKAIEKEINEKFQNN